MSVRRTHSFGGSYRYALPKPAAIPVFSMAARSSEATRRICSECRMWMGLLSAGQASMPVNFWRLPACTASCEARLGARSLHARSHRNATADRVETSRLPISEGRGRAGSALQLPGLEATARTDIRNADCSDRYSSDAGYRAHWRGAAAEV